MNAADWLERNLAATGKPRTLSDDERRCVEVLASIRAIYNLCTATSITDSIEFVAGGLSVLVHEELSTYDDAGLTRLVVAAHRHSVRVAIRPWQSNRYEERARMVAEEWEAEHEVEFDWEALSGIMEILLTPRTPGVTGKCWEGHPTAADLARQAIPAEQATS